MVKISFKILFNFLTSSFIFVVILTRTYLFFNHLILGTLRDEGIGSIQIADFILYMLNKHSVFDYVEFMELEHPYDDTMEMLCDYAKKKNWYRKLSKRYTGMCRL